MVSWMTYAPKPKKVTTVTICLVETEPEKTLHCCGCRESGHTKNDPNFPKNLKKKGHSTKKPKHRDPLGRGEIQKEAVQVQSLW